MTRRIIQIAATEVADEWPTVFALCNDQTIWINSGGSGTGWQQLPLKPIPQPEERQ